MAGWVLNAYTTIDGDVFAEGSTPPDDIAARCGEHLRRYVSEGGSAVAEVVEPEPEPLVLAEADRGGKAFFQAPEAGDAAAVEHPAIDTPDLPPAGTVDEGAPEVPEPATPEPVEPADPADEPAPSEPVEIEVPNRGGKGSSKAHWLEYARSQRVEVSDDMERHEVIAACEAAGVPVD